MPHPAPVPPSTLPRWPVAARDVEHAAVLDALLQGAGAFVCGDAGVGKTVLTRAAAEEAAARLGVPVVARSGTTPDEGVDETVAPLGAARVGATGPVAVVLVDDAHLLGDAAAASLARHARAGTIALALTARRATTPEPLLALWRDGVLERVDLGPLTRAQVAALLADALGDVVVHASWDIWQATGGNPFHVREAVRRAVESGALRLEGGVWTWVGPVEVGDRVREVLEVDLARLDPVARRAVEIVALAEPVAERELTALVGLDGLERAIASGLVAEDRRPPEDGFVRTFSASHPVYGAAVRALVPPRRRRTLWSELQAGTAGLAPPDGSLVRRAVWALEVDVERPDDVVLAAARTAAQQGDADAALRLASEVLRRGGDRAVRVDAHLLAARVHRFLDAPDAAALELSRAEQEAAGLVDEGSPGAVTDREVELVLLWADLDQYHRDDIDGALDRLSALDRRLAGCDEPSGAELRRVVARDRLGRLGWAGRFDECLPALVAEVSGEAVPNAAMLPLVAPTAFGLAQRGALGEAEGLLDRWVTVAVRHAASAPWSYQELGAGQVMTALWQGDLARAASVLDATFEVDDPRLRFERAAQHAALGRLAAADGRWTAATELLRSAAATFVVRDHSGYLAWCRAWWAYALAAANRRAEAAEVLDLAQRTPSRTSRVILVDQRIGLLQAAATLELAWAPGEAARLADEFGRQGLALGELLAAHVALHRSAPGGADRATWRGRIAAVAPKVDGTLAAAIAGSADALDGTVDDRRRAEEAVRAAGGWLPAPSVLSRLSGRQAEVARLAAEGLSSRVIADRLFLSPRTVETHIANIFTRLDVHSRAELASLLG